MEAWREFYFLLGTAGVTLTGLLFVVVSLGPHVVARHMGTGVRAFISPNAVYFTTVFVVSAVLMIPHLPETAIAVFLCVVALTLLGYMAYARSHRPVRDQKVPLEDWISYLVLPVTGFLLLLLAGVSFWLRAALAAHVTAVALILLIVVGIRNAWDLVIWIAQQEHGFDSKSTRR